MAGMPLRRMKRANLPAQIPAGRLPPDFSMRTDAQKLQIMLGVSLDQAAQVMLWDVNRLDGSRLALWNMVRHDLWNIAFKLGIEDHRSQERERALKALVARLPSRFRPKEDDEPEKAN
jgi:hypothetical protein